MPPQDLEHGALLFSASAPLGVHLRLQLTVLAPIEDPNSRTPRRPKQIAPRPTQSHITSFGRAVPPRGGYPIGNYHPNLHRITI